MSPEQSRAARGWLGWSQDDLAKRARVSLSTVRDFEKGRHTPIGATLDAMRRAVETAGVRLVFAADGSPEGIAISRGKADAA
jgi:ribosome-binding protein aMBF1 (putative translation factor)